MILSTHPSQWNSVHRPIPYVYEHEERQLYFDDNSGGKLRVYISPTFTHTPVAGEKIFISGITADADAVANYNGLHTVVSVSGNAITTNTDYDGDITAGTVNVTYIRLPQIKLYAGYLTGEEYDDELPSELVATFTPENSPDNNVQFDVSEYLKSIFEIVPPVEGIDFNMFNRFRLFFDGIYHEYYQVLNSSIKTEDLMSDYVDTGAHLNSQQSPIVFQCGKTILSSLTGNVVLNEVYDGEIPNNGDYNSDFNNDYHNES